MSMPSNARTETEAARTSAAEMEQRSYRSLALRAGLGVGVVALLLWRYDARPTLRAMASEPIGYFAATVALYVAGQVMSAYRWQLLAQLNGIGGRYREYLAYYFIGMATNLFMPGMIGGDALRGIYLGRRQSRIGDAVASVVADRGIGLLAMFWYAGACALLVTGVPLPRAVIRLTLVVGAASLAVYCAAPLIALQARRLPGRLGATVALILPYLHRPLALMPAIILSLILQASLAVCQYILAVGLGLNIPLATIMLILPLANILAALPLTINGLGVREAAYLVLFGFAGVEKHDAIAISLLMFAATAMGGLTGVIAFMTTAMPRGGEIARGYVSGGNGVWRPDVSGET
jgi:glycosyltransferase 2 family protein